MAGKKFRILPLVRNDEIEPRMNADLGKKEGAKKDF